MASLQVPAVHSGMVRLVSTAVAALQSWIPEIHQPHSQKRATHCCGKTLSLYIKWQNRKHTCLQSHSCLAHRFENAARGVSMAAGQVQYPDFRSDRWGAKAQPPRAHCRGLHPLKSIFKFALHHQHLSGVVPRLGGQCLMGLIKSIPLANCCPFMS